MKTISVYDYIKTEAFPWEVVTVTDRTHKIGFYVNILDFESGFDWDKAITAISKKLTVIREKYFDENCYYGDPRYVETDIRAVIEDSVDRLGGICPDTNPDAVIDFLARGDYSEAWFAQFVDALSERKEV